jgi:hypothetical protein
MVEIMIHAENPFSPRGCHLAAPQNIFPCFTEHGNHCGARSLLPRAHLAKVGTPDSVGNFESFLRGAAAHRKGLGLGLYITPEIAKFPRKKPEVSSTEEETGSSAPCRPNAAPCVGCFALATLQRDFGMIGASPEIPL